MTNPKNIQDAFSDFGKAAQKAGQAINGNDLGVQKKPMRPASRMNEPTPMVKFFGGFSNYLLKIGLAVILVKLVSYITHPGNILSGFYQASWLEVCYPLIASVIVLVVGIIIIGLIRVFAKYA